MRRVRVAHVITRLCKGGAQENTFHTVRLADGNRFDVDLVSGPTDGDEGSIEEAVRDAGIEILREPALVRAVSPARDWRAMRRLTRLFRDRRYDIVHTHTSKAGYVGRLAAARAGVPIVVHTPHGHIFHGYFTKPVTKGFILLERYAARKTHRLIALTPRGIEEQLEQGIGRPDQWTSIFSGIDLAPYDCARERRDETRRALNVAPKEILVGAVGRLEPVKGFTYFVQAARAIAQRAPQTTFILVGDGSLRGPLREESEALGDRFRMLGLREDVPDLMAAMEVFVLPSLNEGMGRVLLECGAAGIPAVASAVGGVPDLIEDGRTGYLVAPGDPGAAAEAVMRLVADSELRAAMGARAREKVVPAYGLRRMVDQIEALYETLIEERSLDA